MQNLVFIWQQSGWLTPKLNQTVDPTEVSTLDSGINIGVRLLIFELFSRGYVLIREGNAYIFSKYPLFYGVGDAYFKGYT